MAIAVLWNVHLPLGVSSEKSTLLIAKKKCRPFAVSVLTLNNTSLYAGGLSQKKHNSLFKGEVWEQVNLGCCGVILRDLCLDSSGPDNSLSYLSLALLIKPLLATF